MIKDLMKQGRKFHYIQKESYSPADVENIINQRDHFIGSEYDNVITSKFDDIKKSNEALELKHKEVTATVETVTKERDEFKVNFEALKTEFEPLKKVQTEKSAKSLLEGKVLSGAEIDVYADLKDKLVFKDGMKDEEKTSLVDNVVTEYLEGKSYLKPVVKEEEKELGDKKDAHIVSAKEDEKKDKEYTGKHVLRKTK